VKAFARIREKEAFTLVEVMVAVFLAGVMITSMLAGFTMSFQGVQLDRENSRAAQILVEKTELCRLYTWDQVTGKDTNSYIPTNFTVAFYPGTNNGGFLYTGAVSIAKLSTTASYSNDLRAITVTLNWISGKAARTRSMTTWVSQYGMQNYLY
jgi:Tfp pilus assembly protein PilV